MRPSWPPPSTPRRSDRALRAGRAASSTACGLLGAVARAAPRGSPGASSPRIAAASSAALTAPARADGERADGDAGRHLHDREQRVDAAAARCDSTGTPSTGRTVLAALMPGRCAAPPAPGDDHLEPARLGGRRRTRTAGRACGGPRRRAPRAARRARRASSAAWRIVSQSDREPMMTPTSGSEAKRRRLVDRPAVDQRRRHTRASPIGPAPRSKTSRSSTTRSAALPVSSEPVSPSRWLT